MEEVAEIGTREKGRTMAEYEIVMRQDFAWPDAFAARETVEGESALAVAKSAAETVGENVVVEVVLDDEIAATAAGGYVRGAGYVVSVTKDGRVLQEDLYESRIEAMEKYDAMALNPSCSMVLARVTLDENGDYDCMGEIVSRRNGQA